MPCLTSDPCREYEDSDYIAISQFFHGFFMDNNGNIIEYNITLIDNVTYLIFTDENNDKLYYTAENLSTLDFEKFGFSIYPNPAQDQLNIRFLELANNTSLEIYDIHGKLLKSLMINDLETHLDVSEYASGVYFVRLIGESNNTQIKKFIKI